MKESEMIWASVVFHAWRGPTRNIMLLSTERSCQILRYEVLFLMLTIIHINEKKSRLFFIGVKNSQARNIKIASYMEWL